MTTALDIITGGAKELGVLFKNEQLSADEANDGLVLLNDMLDSWSNDNLATFTYQLESFSLTGATSYTMGTGGTFNTTRPLSIDTAVVRVASIDYPLQFITQEEYQLEINTKSITSPIPQYITSDNGYPLVTLNLWPIGTSGSTLRMLSNKPLSNLALLTTLVDLPPGWKRALKTNVGLEMAPQYGVEPPPSLIRKASQSLGAIKRSTAVNNAMPFMPSKPARYSIYSGTPGN